MAGDLGSVPELRRSPGEGNGNPLQYSCLESPMDRGAWQVAWALKELDTTESLILLLSHKYMRTSAAISLRSAWINGQRIRLSIMVISLYRWWQTMPLEAENFEKILSLFKAVFKPISTTWHSVVIFYRIFVCWFFALSFWLYFEDYLFKKMINFHLLSFISFIYDNNLNKVIFCLFTWLLWILVSAHEVSIAPCRLFHCGHRLCSCGARV